MVLLEVCVDSVVRLEEAVRGGAHRLEVCAALRETDGLTPSEELVRRAVATGLPVHAMVRVNADGRFRVTAAQLGEMEAQIGRMRELGVAGVVVGVLGQDGELDLAAMEQLVRAATAAPALAVTIHRCFDQLRDPAATLQAVRLHLPGVTHILTSGVAGGPATAGYATLRQLVQQQLQLGITVVAGGGVRAHNWRELVRETSVGQIHSSQVFSVL